MVIMSAMDSTLYSLDDVATAIWKALDGAIPLHEVIERKLYAEFDVSPKIAAPDVERFVEQLSAHGILVVSDQPIVAASPKSAGSDL
jgi:Coenzyme PQQ synthesis protein D (PqqD)